MTSVIMAAGETYQTELSPAAVLALIAGATPPPFFVLATVNGDVLVNAYIISSMREW